MVEGFPTYHVMNPYDDGIGLDEYVDWLIHAGYPLQRIPGYEAWLQRFDTALHALPDKQRQASLLPLLHNYQRPEKPVCGSMAPTDRFRAAVQDAKIGPDKDIPHVAAPVIIKYITDLQLLGLLVSDGQNTVTGHEQPERGLLADPPGAILQASTCPAGPQQGTPRHRELLVLPTFQPRGDVRRRGPEQRLPKLPRIIGRLRSAHADVWSPTNAVSPIRQHLPKAILGTSRSTITWMNGSAVCRTTSASGVGNSAPAAEYSCSHDESGPIRATRSAPRGHRRGR